MNKPASELIALAANCPELNMSNYNESDVEELNNWAIEIATTIDRTVANQSGSERAGSMAAQWTYDPDAETYYFAPMQAAAPPYLKQRHVEAIIDIAADGTLAGVELIDNMPPPPALATPPAQPAPASGESSTSSDGTLPLYETAGGFPVAAAPYQAEETGVIQSTRQGAGVERGMDQCVTGGESAATPSTHGKPDGAVREAVCCSAISPCEYQRTHRTGVCETCQKAAALSPKIATAETSPGDVIAMKEVLGHIRTAILEARLEVVTDTLWMPERLSKNETVVDYIAAAIDRLDVKAEAKSQEPGTVIRRVSVPEGQTPLDDRLSHKYLDVFNEGVKSRDTGAGSPYHGHSLEHCLHAAGWVQRDLRLALDKARATTKPEAPAVSVDAIRCAIHDAAMSLPPSDFGSHRAIEAATTAIAALIAGER